MDSLSPRRRLRFVVLAAVAVVTATAFVALGAAAPSLSSAQAQYAPANTAPPTISDTTPQSGQQLTASPGTWSGDQPIVFTYQWLRCNPAGNNCVEIPAAAAQSYTAQAADVGNALRVRVTGTNASGTSAATSAATSPVTAGPAPPAPGSTIPVTAVPPTERLVPSQFQFSPNPINLRAGRIDVRVRVRDTRGFLVSGALVYARSTPLVTSTTGEARTGDDGWAQVTLVPRRNFSIIRFQDNLQLFVRARKDGDPLTGGISGRRLVQVRIR